MEFQLPASNDGLHCILVHVALCQYLTHDVLRACISCRPVNLLPQLKPVTDIVITDS